MVFFWVRETQPRLIHVLSDHSNFNRHEAIGTMTSQSVSGMSPNCVEVDKYAWRQYCLAVHRATRWRTWVMEYAAEATKAGSASEITRLIPSTPSRSGSLAWIRWISDRSQLISWTECSIILSELLREGWSADELHRKRWRTLGALNDNLSRSKASWDWMMVSLSTGSSRRFLTLRQARHQGTEAPPLGREASADSSQLNDCIRASSAWRSLWAINSHSDTLRHPSASCSTN